MCGRVKLSVIVIAVLLGAGGCMSLACRILNFSLGYGEHFGDDIDVGFAINCTGSVYRPDRTDVTHHGYWTADFVSDFDVADYADTDDVPGEINCQLVVSHPFLGPKPFAMKASLTPSFINHDFSDWYKAGWNISNVTTTAYHYSPRDVIRREGCGYRPAVAMSVKVFDNMEDALRILIPYSRADGYLISDDGLVIYLQVSPGDLCLHLYTFLYRDNGEIKRIPPDVLRSRMKYGAVHCTSRFK